MKLKLATILFAFTAMISMTSCEEENWRETNLPPTDVDAEEVVLTDVLASDGARVRPYYVFTVELGTSGATKTGSGIVLEAKFVSNGTSLHQAVYTAAESGAAGRNNFITGETGTKLYLDGKAHLVTAGSIDVKSEGANYSLTGTVKLDDNTWFNLAWEGGALAWGELPLPVSLVEVTSAQSNIASGVNSVTINLSDGNWKEELDMTTWQSVITGKGNYLAIDFYSADGYLEPGTYKASATGGVVNEGEFGIGYDTTVDWGFGPMEMKDWGTCWWTVDADAEVQKTAKKITEGEIIVELAKDKTYTIYMDNDQLIAEFVGKIPAVTKPDKPAGGDNPGGDNTQYTELTNLISATKNQSLLTINMGQEGISSETDPNTWQTVWSGNGNYLALDIYSADGKLYTGEYTACETGGVVGEGQFGIGYDTEFWGMQMYNWGTCWWTVADGTTSAEKILDGTIKVSVKGDNLIIRLNSSVANARFTYPIADFVDGTGAAIEVVNLGGDDDEGGESGDTGNYVALTQFFSMTDYNPNGITMVGLELGTEGLTATEMDFFGYKYVQIGGNGNHLKVEIYSADGTLAPGTYVPCATEGAPGEGEFNYGYDYVSDYGSSVYGSCWSTYESDAVTASEKITDGTITVEADGDVYTITLNTSVVSARYVGKLSAE